MSIKKKFVALMAACAIVLALPAMAFAADYTAATVGADQNSVKVTIDSTFASKSCAKMATDENVTLTWVSGEAFSDFTAPEKTDVKGHDFANAKSVTLAAPSESLITSETVAYEKTMDSLFNGISFAKPGYYNFTLAETTGSNVNLKYDTKTYTVQVVVTVKDDDPTSLQVSKVYVKNAAGEKVAEGAGPAAFANASNAGKDFTITQVVTGNAADKDKSFMIWIDIPSGLSGDYTVILPNGTIGSKWLDGHASHSSIGLKHGETYTIKGLPQGVEITTTQTDSSGYTLTETAVNGVAVEPAAAEAKVTIEAPGEGVNSIQYTNKKTATPATGLIMEFGPYVLIALAAIAAAVVFVIARRRRRESDEF